MRITCACTSCTMSCQTSHSIGGLFIAFLNVTVKPSRTVWRTNRLHHYGYTSSARPSYNHHPHTISFIRAINNDRSWLFIARNDCVYNRGERRSDTAPEADLGKRLVKSGRGENGERRDGAKFLNGPRTTLDHNKPPSHTHTHTHISVVVIFHTGPI